MIITIDGPAGTGKTTVAERVAKSLSLPYFDTGAMYRAVTYLCLQKKINLADEAAVRGVLTNFRFEIREMSGSPQYFANEENVTEAIRSSQVTALVSAISALGDVRQVLWNIQRRFAKEKGGVFEGRDMGSVVFPDAERKFFLTATPEIRARRRLEELKAKSPHITLTHAEMMEEILKRDKIDSSRELAPLKAPQGAYIIDTSELTLDQVVEEVLRRCGKKQRKNFLYQVIIRVARFLCRLLYRLKVYGFEHFYAPGAILAANHTSFLDPPIVSVAWPEEVHFLARESLFHPKWFGGFIRRLNAHPVSGEAGDIRVIKTICSLLEEGRKVILFPEGTRSASGELQPIKPGIGMLVAKSKTAVIPVYVQGAYEIWGRKRKWPRLFGKIVCVFGSPITWSSVQNLEKKKAQQILSERLEKAWRDLKTWLEQGARGTPP